MTVATLERDGTEITLPLVDEGGGAPLLSMDIGKPEAGATNKGSLNPRWSDQFSRLETYTLNVRFTHANAYQNAIALTDLVKSFSGGDDLILNVDFPEIDDDLKVAPAPGQDQTLSLVYDPGGTDWVDAELSLTRVEATAGSGSDEAVTPTATGDGPVTLTDGTTSVEFRAGIAVDRSVGRPNSVTRSRGTDLPIYEDKRKSAFDEFELAVEFTHDVVNRVSDLVSLVGRRHGRGGLTLDFNGQYGLGAFDVVPRGNNALRTVRPSGEEGTIIVPNLTLRRILV